MPKRDTLSALAMAMIKAHLEGDRQQLDALTELAKKDPEEIERRLGATGGVQMSLDPDPEVARDEMLMELHRNFDRHVYFHPETGVVWVTTHDADSERRVEAIVRSAEKIHGVSEVRCQPEASPGEGKGWWEYSFETGPVRLSLTAGRSPVESASSAVDRIIDLGAQAGIAVSDEVRRRVRRLVRQRSKKNSRPASS